MRGITAKPSWRPQDLTCCRVIFGEADSFPGLTVDRFGDILVTQTLSLGMEQRKSRLFPLLCQVLREDGQDIRAVYERNDVPLREREGLEENKGFSPDGRGTASPLPPSRKTASPITWMWKTAKRPAFSWTRSSTGKR